MKAEDVEGKPGGVKARGGAGSVCGDDDHLIDTVAGANTARPVACITLYPFFGDWGQMDLLVNAQSTADAYRQALREAVEACPHPNVHLFEGEEVLTDWSGLTGDLIHPADNGMIEMGANLARLLRPLIAGR